MGTPWTRERARPAGSKPAVTLRPKAPRRLGRRASWLLLAALCAAVVFGCRIERDAPAGTGVHPVGYADTTSEHFHGLDLAARGFPLGECRRCHGDDYHGGAVGVSCTASGCHAAGVESCNTCHKSPPETGAHTAHAFECATCHQSHTDARSPDHPNGQADVHLGGLAATGGYAPGYDETSKTCQNVYCHLGQAVKWDHDATLGCGGCHAAPPPSHARFATAGSDCTTCHGPMSSHVNGKVDVAELACDTCHGKGPLGAPPPLLPSTDAAIGDAHARHLDPTLPDRMGRVARCDGCHVVPASVTAPGHLDASAPADVSLEDGESYDATSRSCVVRCHGSRDPGPRWGDDSGAPRACDACHGFPPVQASNGVTHPPAAPDLNVCVTCHVFDPSTHVDGKVDFVSSVASSP